MTFQFLALTGPFADFVSFLGGLTVMVGLPLVHEYLKKGEYK